MPAELLERDPAVLAPLAGLVYHPDSEQGFERRRRGSGFSYLEGGEPVAPAVRQRIESLAIPPAWRDVWISPHADGHLAASGVDDADRKQYLYHPDFRAFCDDRKFERMQHFARALPDLRHVVADGLDAPLGTRTLAVSAAVQLIDRHLLRVGNEQSASDGHHGASTLETHHVADDEDLRLEYTGKGGQERAVVVDDDDLADVISALAEAADDRVFWFVDDTVSAVTEQHRCVAATDINQFIVDHAGPAFSAKDFRTWGGSAAALERRAAGDEPLSAVDGAADALGNTRAVARSSYVHPFVLEADDDEVAEVWTRSRSSKWMQRRDSALRKLLTGS